MKSVELTESTERAQEYLKKELGDLSGLGIVPGTGWDGGVKTAFRERAAIDYGVLGIPDSGKAIEGHRKALRVGDIKGRDTLVLGRVHPNEDITNPDLRQAMAILIGGLRHHLKGVIVTNGVGTLHGPVGLENGRLHSAVRTAILDILGWAHRGRRQEPIGVGDIAIVDDLKTGWVGSQTSLGAGDFVDFYHGGVHRDNDRYFNLARRVVTAVQGRCPRAQMRFVTGPQFEGPGDKIECRAQGDDVIGMNGLEILKCAKEGIPFVHLVLATNGPFSRHSHAGNQHVGEQNAGKCAAILQLLSRDWPV